MDSGGAFNGQYLRDVSAEAVAAHAFDGELVDIIANNFVGDMSQSVVTISASDTGFYTDPECGTWTYVGL